MYFFNPTSYTMSALTAADRYLLDFARTYENHAVSWPWIQAFTAFLKRKQEELIKRNPRIRPVDIYCKVDPSYTGSSKMATIRVGTWYVHLRLIEAEHNSFEEPLL